ncbi:MAG TPA: ribosome-associated translation inhibitor RaiA [Candidatus Paceibacterota bacterium]
MKVNIKATGIELTGAITAYLTDKLNSLDKILTRFGDVYADAEVSKTTSHHHKGEVYRAEINLRTSSGLFRAESTSSDLYAAIDLVKDELSEKLKSTKDRSDSLYIRGSRLVKRLLRRN